MEHRGGKTVAGAKGMVLNFAVIEVFSCFGTLNIYIYTYLL